MKSAKLRIAGFSAMVHIRLIAVEHRLATGAGRLYPDKGTAESRISMIVMLLLFLITLISGIALGVLGVTALAICSEDRSVRRIRGVRRLCGARLPLPEEARRQWPQ